MKTEKRICKKCQQLNLFISKYNWKWINFPSAKDDSKIFEKNNVTIVLNVSYAKKEDK